MLVVLWQVTGEGKIDLATGTVLIAAAWFINLFLGE
jgi:hypothetical protein